MPKPRAVAEADRESMIAEAALRLLKRDEWAEITLAAVARSAGLPLSDVLCIVPAKSALPGTVLRVLVNETARGHRGDPKSAAPRERVFDATMTFFDVQELHGTALKKLYRALRYDPPTLLAVRNDILRLAGEILALAEADTGLSPRVQAAVFAVILIRAVAAWGDDDEGMGKTMAQLDGDLRHVERFLWPKTKQARRSRISAETTGGRRESREPGKRRRRG